jgi:hypothetical protein
LYEELFYSYALQNRKLPFHCSTTKTNAVLFWKINKIREEIKDNQLRKGYGFDFS